MKQICETLKIDYDPSTGMCKIDKGYCTEKGANWTYNEKIKDYDSSVPMGQTILENVFETTLTRALKIGLVNVINSGELTKPPAEIVDDLMYSGLDLVQKAARKQGGNKSIGPIKIRDKCLDVKQGKHPKLQIWDCNGTPNQTFQYDKPFNRLLFKGTIENNPEGYNYCVETPFNDQFNGTILHLNRCVGEFKTGSLGSTVLDGAENQIFLYNESNGHIQKSSGSIYSNDQCLDLLYDDNTNGNNFQLLNCKDHRAQTFNIPTTRVDIDSTEATDLTINCPGFR